MVMIFDNYSQGKSVTNESGKKVNLDRVEAVLPTAYFPYFIQKGAHPALSFFFPFSLHLSFINSC